MNCADVVHFLIEPGDAPTGEARQHLVACEACRAQLKESRRVAGLLAALPQTPDTDIAARVMNRIGYGNGRPTSDKIAEQLDRIRGELESVIEQLEQTERQWCRSPDAPLIHEILAHLQCEERSLLRHAEQALTSGVPGAGVAGDDRRVDSADDAGATGINGGSRVAGKRPVVLADTSGATSLEELRRVRSRTLRLISGIDQSQLGHTAAELLRAIYRHEADHAAQIADVAWQCHRQAELNEHSL